MYDPAEENPFETFLFVTRVVYKKEGEGRTGLDRWASRIGASCLSVKYAEIALRKFENMFQIWGEGAYCTILQNNKGGQRRGTWPTARASGKN